MTARDVIINRLAKLLRLKNDAEKSGNDETRKNEAERVTAKIAHLRSKYNITDEEIRQAENFDAVGNFFTNKIKTQAEHLSWQQLLAKGIAHSHTCQILTTKDRKAVRFVGSQRDIAVCSAQFHILNTAAIDAFELVKREIEEVAPKHLKRDFFQGFVGTILIRLRERQAQSQALMRIGQDLVRYMDKNFDKEEPGQQLSTEITNYLAMLAGARAARKQSLEVNLLKEEEKV